MIIQAYLYSALIIFISMTIAFCIAHLKKNNGVADIAWGTGFMLISLFTFFKYGSYSAQQTIATLLVLIWGTRISGYLALRNWNKQEDSRYAAMRAQWGDQVIIRSFLQIFMLQGAILLIIMAPVIIINCSAWQPWHMINFLGLSLWIIGFLCETIGDYQLHRFLQKTRSQGQIMTQGLWKYTRHPNYFGESMMWWGIWIIALSSPYGVLTIISPLLLTYLLLYVSGIPLAEISFKNNLAYQEYAQRTSSFIPWPPKDSL